MSSIRWVLAGLARPLIIRLPPWYRVRVYNRLVEFPCASGAMSASVVRRVAPHCFKMELDLSDWMERAAALTGIFYEIEVTALLERLLRPNDTFVDVGGNLGFVSLTARRLIGLGKLIYVEPNAQLVSRFRATCVRNDIRAEIVHAALGEANGRVGLSATGHHGTSKIIAGDEVLMLRADDLPIPLETPCFVKIDVEGYEEIVLQGAGRLLERHDCAFLVEITDEWLRGKGGGAANLFDTMHSHGFGAWRATLSRKGLQLEPIKGPLNEFQYDVLFAHSQWLLDRSGGR